MPVLTSEPQGWDGLVVEHRRREFHAGGFALSALSTHLITLNLGASFFVRQECAGHVQQGDKPPSGIAILPAGMPAAWRLDGRVDVLHLSVEPLLLERVAVQGGLKRADQIEVVAQFGGPDPHIEHIGRALRAELEAGLGGRLYAESLATALAAHLLRRYSSAAGTAIHDSGAGLSPSQLRRTLAYLQEHLARNVTLTEIAAQAAVSPSHFGVLFRRSTGQSPHQYLVRQRVERARVLLCNTNRPLAEIAAAVGFCDQSHLARHMRRLLNVSPRQIRGQA